MIRVKYLSKNIFVIVSTYTSPPPTWGGKVQRKKGTRTTSQVFLPFDTVLLYHYYSPCIHKLFLDPFPLRIAKVTFSRRKDGINGDSAHVCCQYNLYMQAVKELYENSHDTN